MILLVVCDFTNGYDWPGPSFMTCVTTKQSAGKIKFAVVSDAATPLAKE